MRPKPRTRRLLVGLAAAAIALLAVAPAALAGTVFPERGGSPNADDIATLYKITFYIGVAIFLLVEGALLYSLVKYRRRRGGPEPEQIRGNTPLEIGWTLGAAFILVILSVVTFVYLDDIKNPERGGPGTLASAPLASVNQPPPPGGRTLEIDVTGLQYLWRYEYPGREPLFAYYRLVVPEDTTVVLNVTSADVQHSWWAPRLGGKVDAVPGHTNRTWFKARQPGTYYAVCAELCGDNHADMRAVVDVRPVSEYLAWAAQQRRDIREAQEGLAEQRRRREEAARGEGEISRDAADPAEPPPAEAP